MKKFYPMLIENEEHNGKWAVASGAKNKVYYPSTVCDTEEDAKRQCIIWMMRDLYDKASRLYDEGVEEGLLDAYSMGDYLA